MREYIEHRGVKGGNESVNRGISRYGPENPARILPLVSGSGNHRVLTEWLDQQPEYEPIQVDLDSESIPETAFDLCILDQHTLEEHVEELRSRKAAASPTLIPYLLLFPEENPSVIALDRGELAEAVIRESVDEIVSLPLKKAELNWRIKALLRLRSQSLQLRAEEKHLRRFKKAADAAGHAVYITDEEGTIEYVNDAFERITGYDSTDAIGENPRLLNSGEMPDSYFEDLWETVLDGEIWEEEVINRRKDGEIYYAQQTIAPITGPEGITAFVAIQSDLTKRKRLEDELRAAKNEYESLFTSTRDAILVADTERQIIDCNPAFTELFGYELSEIEGKHTKYVYESEAEYEEMGEAITGHMEDPEFTYTVTYEKKSGQTFPGETNVYYLRDSANEVAGYIGVIRDVSERQERLKQLQIIDRILQHNFNNDINVILGNAQFVQEEAPSPYSTYADRILETGNTLLDTVGKEREITEFLSDPPSTDTISLEQTLDAILSRVGEEHPDADISASYQEAGPVMANMAIDRAFEELVTNSIVHSDAEEPRVEIEVESTAESVEIRVKDENQLIPEMERKILAGDQNLTPLQHGSGMGLWLVTLIVQHSDGVVEFAENEPTGNIVQITLPVA